MNFALVGCYGCDNAKDWRIWCFSLSDTLVLTAIAFEIRCVPM